MDAEGGEFQDWEVLQQSDSGSESSDPVQNFNDFEEIDTHSGGMIRTDYFSVAPLQNIYARTVSGADVSEVASENSDNPSWIDPNSETRYPRKEAGEFWSDSSSDRSDDRKFVEFEWKNEMGFDGNEKLQVGFDGNEKLQLGFDGNEKLQLGFDGNEKLQVGFKGIEEISGPNEKTLDKIASGVIELDSMEVGDLDVASEPISKENVNLEALHEEKHEKESIEGESLEIEARKVEQGEEKKSVVWWKVPIEFLRYCVFRASPVWTFSVAAAVMGFVILGRRLYKMKRKTRGLELKVTMDDKKISQFMSRAARLNEAFSVVKRVPVIRPSFPAVGVTPWPVMSLR